MQRDTLSFPIPARHSLGGGQCTWDGRGDPKVPSNVLRCPPSTGGSIRAELRSQPREMLHCCLWDFSRKSLMVRAHQCKKGCVLVLDCLMLA